MRRLIIILLMTSAPALALVHMSVKDMMAKVADRYGVSFVYNPSLPVESTSALLEIKEERLEDVLDALFRNTGISWTRSGKYIVLKSVKNPAPLTVELWNADVDVQMDTIVPSIITSDKKQESALSKLSVDISDVKCILSPLGEGDPIKWAQKLPGVTTGADGTSAFYVRGGNMGNTLFSLDGVPIYGYSHLLGLTTIIPSAAMQNVTFQKGGFDGRDGNFTSSHLCAATKTPGEGFKTGFALNNFLLSAENEGCFGKLSYVISARISPLTLEYRALRGCLPGVLGEMKDFGADVGDVFGKLRLQINSRSWVEVSGIGSLDGYSFSLAADSQERIKWTNAIGIIKFHTHSMDSYFESTAYVNKYGSEQLQDKTYRGKDNHLSLQSELFEVALSLDRNRRMGRFIIDYGTKLRYAQFSPGQVAAENNRADIFLGNLYFQGRYIHPEKLEMKLSLRGNCYKNFNSDGLIFDPEFSFYSKWQISRSFSIEGSFDRLVQYYHTLEGLPVGWSLDMIVPSGSTVKPESALQGNLGFSIKTGDHTLSIGGFYKRMNNLVYYRYAQEMFSGGMTTWENQVNQGKGSSIGAELLYGYRYRDWSANVSYTISKTNRYGFSDINNGGEFHARFDRTHMLSVFGGWRHFNASFTLQSGHWEDGAAMVYPMHVIGGDEWRASYFSGVNNYHMPMLIRLDLGYNTSFETGRCKHILNLGVCNVTNHFNPFMLYFDSKSETWMELALLPILPNFSYQILF